MERPDPENRPTPEELAKAKAEIERNVIAMRPVPEPVMDVLVADGYDGDLRIFTDGTYAFKRWHPCTGWERICEGTRPRTPAAQLGEINRQDRERILAKERIDPHANWRAAIQLLDDVGKRWGAYCIEADRMRAVRDYWYAVWMSDNPAPSPIESAEDRRLMDAIKQAEKESSDHQWSPSRK